MRSGFLSRSVLFSFKWVCSPAVLLAVCVHVGDCWIGFVQSLGAELCLFYYFIKNSQNGKEGGGGSGERGVLSGKANSGGLIMSCPRQFVAHPYSYSGEIDTNVKRYAICFCIRL